LFRFVAIFHFGQIPKSHTGGIFKQIKQFLPTQAILLKYCLQKTVKKWRFAEVDYSSAHC
jgi:hypothetical protein